MAAAESDWSQRFTKWQTEAVALATENGLSARSQPGLTPAFMPVIKQLMANC
jgi:hypothetical protein